jgi:hypothetical protein
MAFEIGESPENAKPRNRRASVDGHVYRNTRPLVTAGLRVVL